MSRRGSRIPAIASSYVRPRGLREMLDRGDHHGITPSAMFTLCAMFDTAANDDPSVTPQQRRDLLSTAAAIADESYIESR